MWNETGKGRFRHMHDVEVKRATEQVVRSRIYRTDIVNFQVISRTFVHFDHFESATKSKKYDGTWCWKRNKNYSYIITEINWSFTIGIIRLGTMRNLKVHQFCTVTFILHHEWMRKKFDSLLDTRAQRHFHYSITNHNQPRERKAVRPRSCTKGVEKCCCCCWSRS